jgi:hypothetical protein
VGSLLLLAHARSVQWCTKAFELRYKPCTTSTLSLVYLRLFSTTDAKVQQRSEALFRECARLSDIMSLPPKEGSQ